MSNPRLIISHGNAERRFYKAFRDLRLSAKDVCTVSKLRHYSVARTKSQGFTKISECLFLGLLKYSPKSKKFTPKTLDIFLNLWYVVVAKKIKEEMQWQTNADRKVTERYANARTDDGKDGLSSDIRKTVHRYSNRCSAKHKNPRSNNSTCSSTYTATWT